MNNLAHPTLSGLIVDFFYTSPVLVGKLFPEVFSREVLRVIVKDTRVLLYLLQQTYPQYYLDR